MVLITAKKAGKSNFILYSPIFFFIQAMLRSEKRLTPLFPNYILIYLLIINLSTRYLALELQPHHTVLAIS